MAVFLLANYTAASDVTLQLYTPDTGGTWVKHSASGLDMVVDATVDRLRNGSSSNIGWYYNDVTPGSDDYYHEAVFYTETVAAEMAIGVRFATAAQTGYWAGYNATGGEWRMYRAVAGTHTLIDTYVQALAADTAYTGRIEATGTGATVTVTFDIDGVERMSYADTDGTRITARGHLGVRAFDNGSTTQGIHLDSSIGVDTTGGGISIPVLTHHYRMLEGGS